MNRDDIICSMQDRSATYRLLARLFFKPLTQEEIDALASTELAEVAADGQGACDDGRNDIARYLRRRNTGTREELACDFTGAFGGATTVGGRCAMPYESLFRAGEGEALLMGEARGEVYREFKANRARVPEGLDLPEDHLSFMFDYLALLCDRASDRVREGDAAAARELLDRQAEFLRGHVASWYPDFCEVAAQVVQTRFYRGALKLTAAFVEDEPAEIERLGAALQ